MRNLLLLIVATLALMQPLKAQDYNASLFGCVSDGITNNTSSIQYAIDFIAEKGGGKLNFYVGRYLTGGITLKSNVTLELHEGAVLLASPNFYDYLKTSAGYALLAGENIENSSIIGKGVIHGQAKALRMHLMELKAKKYLPGSMESYLPALVSIQDAKNVLVQGIIFRDSPGAVQSYDGIATLKLENQLITSKQAEDNAGIVISNSSAITLKNVFIDTSGQAIESDKNNQFTLVENSVLPNGKSILD